MKHLLDNITWHTLSGPHAKFSLGTDEARRYTAGFSPIAAFENLERPNFADLEAQCQPGEHFYCAGWSGKAPAGWQIDFETTMVPMVWECELPAGDEAPDAIRLGPEHAAQAVELAALTGPGPFGPRTIELGDYFGYFDDQHLVAMAGERLCAGTLREISGVCTHPDFQGRGFARRLMSKLIRLEMLRGEIPVLHVKRDNTIAHGLYERMGFRDYKETVLRVVSMR